MPCCAVW